MFKSRYSPYSSYQKRNRSRPVSPIFILLSIPLILILLELLMRLFVGISGKSGELNAYQGESAIANAYRLQFLNSSQQPYDGLPQRGRLLAQQRTSVGYELRGKQKSQYWQINPQGFRDDQPVPLAKPKGEIRVFILGGSTAFGQMNPNNQATLATKLETRLNQRIANQKANPEKYRPDQLPYFKSELDKVITLPLKLRPGQYRVINAAVPGYTSGNELAQLALEILPYKPDAIVILDGYPDLMLPSNQEETDIPQRDALLADAPGHFGAYLKQQFQNGLSSLYLYKAIHYWIVKPQPDVKEMSLGLLGNEGGLADKSSEQQSRIKRYRDRHLQIAQLTTGAKIPLIVALQPEITGRGSNKITVSEQLLINQLESAYTQKIQTGYKDLGQASQQLQRAFPQTVKTLNFYKLYQNFPQQAFSDRVHLTEAANGLMAEKIYSAIASFPQLQVSPPAVAGTKSNK